jgi:hypothetical protein
VTDVVKLPESDGEGVALPVTDTVEPLTDTVASDVDVATCVAECVTDTVPDTVTVAVTEGDASAESDFCGDAEPGADGEPKPDCDGVDEVDIVSVTLLVKVPDGVNESV